MNTWKNSRCECASGKSSLGADIDDKTECKDCPANSAPTDDTTGCACKTGYEPAWAKDEAKSCGVLIGTNQVLNASKDGFDCKENWIGAKCETACTWAKLKTETDKTAAKALTSCGCKDKIFGDDCSIDCSGDKFTGAGIDSAKRCLCKANTWYDADATECANTCAKVPNSKVNSDTTACECNADYLGDATVSCVKCDKTKATQSCLCKDGFSGDDCATEKKER